MQQREVDDGHGCRWTLAEAVSTAETPGAGKDSAAVTCTPSRGGKTVHLALPKDWQRMSDEDLIRAIETG